MGTPRLEKERERDRGRQKTRVGLISWKQSLGYFDVFLYFCIFLPRRALLHCTGLVSDFESINPDWINYLVGKMCVTDKTDSQNKNRIKAVVINQNHPLSSKLYSITTLPSGRREMFKISWKLARLQLSHWVLAELRPWAKVYSGLKAAGMSDSECFYRRGWSVRSVTDNGIMWALTTEEVSNSYLCLKSLFL